MNPVVIPMDFVEKNVMMSELLVAIEEGFKKFVKGGCLMPHRSIIEVDDLGVMLFMPAYVKPDSASVKIVTVYPRNLDKGLPTLFSLVVYLDVKTGKPLAIIEGSSITAYRTGAVSGVAIKHLAKKNPKRVGIIGAGRQARTQVLAAKEAAPTISKLYVFDIREEKAEDFVGWVGRAGLKLDASVSRDPREVVLESEVIVLATTSRTPVINGEWLTNGSLVVSIGWVGKDSREVDDETLRRSDKLVVDSREAVLQESGDIIDPLKRGVIRGDEIFELGEVVAGFKPGRESEEEIIFFKSVGLAFEDAITARLVYEKAVRAGLTEVSLWPSSLEHPG